MYVSVCVCERDVGHEGLFSFSINWELDANSLLVTRDVLLRWEGADPLEENPSAGVFCHHLFSVERI